MNEKIKIKETIIVEGKYDKIKLNSIIDANIITTNGFKIYNDSEKQALIRNIAKKTGIIIMTDSDTAGKRIRNFIKSSAKGGENAGNTENLNIINIYIPKILGKEKRKSTASKENILGVEGTDKNILINVLNRFGVTDNHGHSNHDCDDCYESKKKKITKTDFYEDKLTGSENSLERRKYLCGVLNIPYMSSNSLIEAVNILSDYGEYKKIVRDMESMYKTMSEQI